MQMSIYLYLAIYYVAAATSVFCAKAKRQQQVFSVRKRSGSNSYSYAKE